MLWRLHAFMNVQVARILRMCMDVPDASCAVPRFALLFVSPRFSSHTEGA